MDSFINTIFPLVWVYQALDAQLTLSKIGNGRINLLIIGGIFLIADRIALEFFNYEIIRRIKDYISLVFSALIIIGIGIKLLFSTGSSKSS